MRRPDLTVLPLPEAVRILGRWVAPHVPAKLLHPHEKISAADLLAVAILQRLHNVPYFSRWWQLLKVNHFTHFPSAPQARVRLARLAIRQEPVQRPQRRARNGLIHAGNRNMRPPGSAWSRHSRCRTAVESG